MRTSHKRLLRRLTSLAALFTLPSVPAQQPAPYTLTVNSRLVFLDVVVLDRKNHPVTSGLTQQDFTVTESHQPQPITSFEPPELHTAAPASNDPASPPEDTFTPSTPRTELVLDRLNSTFNDFAYNLVCIRRYLAAQPARLTSPTELMLLDNTSFELLQAYTTSRDDLLYTLDHLSPALPQKASDSFFSERLIQSVSALREIALRNEGIPGRKNVLWIGTGIGLNTSGLSGSLEKLKWFAHDTTNALVDARISVFQIYPGLNGYGIEFADLFLNPAHHGNGLNQDDPFAGDIGIGAFALETGGAVLSNNNFVDLSIKAAQTYGNNFYTLTYKPPQGSPDGRFRRVTVTVRDPALHVVTKVGYYSADSHAPFNERQQEMFHISSELQSAIPLDNLQLSLDSIVRHTDSRTIEVAVRLAPKDLAWQSSTDGSRLELSLAAASLNSRREILASRLQDLPVTSPVQDPAQLSSLTPRIHVTLHVPRKTETVRIVVETVGHGRAGSLEIARARIEAAQDQPTPQPSLTPRPSAGPLASPAAPAPGSP